MAKKKFNQEQGSIDSKINQLSPEVRRKYKRNRQRAGADYRHFEEWARRGFTSPGDATDREGEGFTLRDELWYGGDDDDDE